MKTSFHTTGLMMLLVLLSCQKPTSEPQFRSYMDSADIVAHDTHGDILRFDAQDCSWGFGEFEGVDDTYSTITIACGDQHEITTQHQTKGNIFAEYQQDTRPFSYDSFTSHIYIEDRSWAWEGYSDQGNCRHDPDSGAFRITSSEFDIKPADDTVPLLDGFDDSYKVTLFFQEKNPMLEEPCIRIEVRGGYFVKY